MARNTPYMQHWRQRVHELLHGFQVLAVLHYQDLVQSQVLQGGYRLGEVWDRDLHFVDLIKVRLRFIEWTVAERVSNVAIPPYRSNDYSKNGRNTSKWKALLLNKVVVGRGMKLTQDNPTLTQPPPGYDSVSILGYFFFLFQRGD